MNTEEKELSCTAILVWLVWVLGISVFDYIFSTIIISCGCAFYITNILHQYDWNQTKAHFFKASYLVCTKVHLTAFTPA